MITNVLLIFSTWTWLVQSAPSTKFQKIQFFPPATSFSIRSDEFISSGRKFPKVAGRNIELVWLPGLGLRLRHGISNFYSRDYSSPGHSYFNSAFDHSQEFFHTSSTGFGENFDIGHITPDFSDGLSYPDPFLRTGADARRVASFLYSKELFFDDIPHERSLMYNQNERRKNGLTPHELGSLRLESPWYRFRDTNRFNGFKGVFGF